MNSHRFTGTICVVMRLRFFDIMIHLLIKSPEYLANLLSVWLSLIDNIIALKRALSWDRVIILNQLVKRKMVF
ncbi:MAG: hypothetical protein ACLFVB_10610 [Thermoplasmata archaeon]